MARAPRSQRSAWPAGSHAATKGMAAGHRSRGGQRSAWLVAMMGDPLRCVGAGGIDVLVGGGVAIDAGDEFGADLGGHRSIDLPREPLDPGGASACGDRPSRCHGEGGAAQDLGDGGQILSPGEFAQGGAAIGVGPPVSPSAQGDTEGDDRDGGGNAIPTRRKRPPGNFGWYCEVVQLVEAGGGVVQITKRGEGVQRLTV